MLHLCKGYGISDKYKQLNQSTLYLIIYIAYKTLTKFTFPVDLSHYPWHQTPLCCWHGLLNLRARRWLLEADAFLIMATLRYLMAEIATDAKVISICSSCCQPFCWFPWWTVNLRNVLLTLYWMCFSRIPSWKDTKIYLTHSDSCFLLTGELGW